jgi:hypothetical protein|nr:hypothetical protein [uncultured Blautia sp.]
MAVKASPEVIRDMEKELLKTAQDLERISSGIQTVLKRSPQWDDEQSIQFMMLMKKIAQLTAQPSQTLRAAAPKLENLAQALDEYGNIRF